MTDKFIGYFRLIEACEQSGCPVCACLEEDSRRALDAILYEHVTDPETRRSLRDAWGFCNWHAWSLLDGDTAATGAAILYEDLVRVCHQRIQRVRGRTSRFFWRPLSWLRAIVTSAEQRVVPRVVTDYGDRPRCPVCTRLGVAEERYLDTFVDFADDPQFSRAYQQSTGLCLPHLLIAVGRCPGTDIETIVRATLTKWQHLRGDLERFVSKHEYRSAEPITEMEATSYHRGAEVLAGRRHHFGNDMRAGAGGRR